MTIARTAVSDDDGSGITGTVFNNAFITALYNQIDAMVGVWADVTFNAGRYVPSAGQTWTVDAGDQILCRYKVVDGVLFWAVKIATSSLGGTPAARLFIAAPPGLTFQAGGLGCVASVPIGAQVTVYDGTYLAIDYPGGGNWPASTNLTYVSFFFVGQVA